LRAHERLATEEWIMTMLGERPERMLENGQTRGWQGPRHGSRDSGGWFLVDFKLQRVAIRVVDVDNNFAKDEALSRFMFIWRREENSHRGSASWRMLVVPTEFGV
jgi:hypothetical protein